MFDDKFNVAKALQALYYLQTHTDNPASSEILYLLKMIYFADRYHIRHFGNLATGDVYVAMKLGPVASNIKDLLKGQLKNDSIEEISEYSVKIKPQGMDELSESFVESLNFAIATYGKFSAFVLSDISHDYPEWSKFKDDLKTGKIKSAVMDLQTFFDDPENLQISNKYQIKSDPFYDSKEFLQEMKEDFYDTLTI